MLTVYSLEATSSGDGGTFDSPKENFINSCVCVWVVEE